MKLSNEQIKVLTHAELNQRGTAEDLILKLLAALADERILHKAAEQRIVMLEAVVAGHLVDRDRWRRKFGQEPLLGSEHAAEDTHEACCQDQKSCPQWLGTC